MLIKDERGMHTGGRLSAAVRVPDRLFVVPPSPPAAPPVTPRSPALPGAAGLLLAVPRCSL
ncbi:hypothetical protein K458DRAFT_142027 [Lentithecium fluviatile CBS 122367]|uniref:Uncharacterized protein n=1 Tax=Lentithecium fluviatile CBS 122367 TaxID=1168545 RepID=A0A6G1IIV4_9PLEO|nr:hypothetical protein K458DRAFT_142027 [Lentithecium fluviatile CBS 122367]